MASQYFAGLFEHKTAVASITDLTPPTFAGISSLTARPNGSIRPVWLVATDASTPVKYEVYVQAATATGLFSTSNIAYISNNLTIDVFQLANSSLLVKNVTYFVGIRAVDAVGNRDTNTGSTSVVSVGVLDDDLATIAVSLAATEVLLAADEVNISAEVVNFAAENVTLAATEADIASDAQKIENAANLLISTVV